MVVAFSALTMAGAAKAVASASADLRKVRRFMAYPCIPFSALQPGRARPAIRRATWPGEPGLSAPAVVSALAAAATEPAAGATYRPRGAGVGLAYSSPAKVLHILWIGPV